MKFSKSLALVFSLLILFFLSACGGGGGGGDSDSGGTGTLSVSLTDSAGSYKAVYISIEGVEVHTGGNENNNKNWVTIPMDLDTINLCDLTNGVFEELGSIRLSSGKYTQMRLILSNVPEDNELNILSELHPSANYVILDDTNNTVEDLKIPSGFQTGVKIVKGFTINANQTTEILLDFDASRSVVEAGNSGQWLLKPTIKVGELKEYSIINGRVTDDSGNIGIPNALVSAQKFVSNAQYEEDKVIVQAATITDTDGYYSLFVKPDTYNLVAYADNKIPDFERIQTAADQVLDDNNFQLSDATDVGNIVGSVNITGGSNEDQYATISYRKGVSCTGCESGEMIEIKSINILNTYDYQVELPVGTYERVASTFGYTTQTDQIDVIAGDNTDDIHDITF